MISQDDDLALAPGLTGRRRRPVRPDRDDPTVAGRQVVRAAGGRRPGGGRGGTASRPCSAVAPPTAAVGAIPGRAAGRRSGGAALGPACRPPLLDRPLIGDVERGLHAGRTSRRPCLPCGRE